MTFPTQALTAPIGRRARSLLRRAAVPALALLTAFIPGAVLIVATDFESLQRIDTDPVGALASAFGLVLDGYGAIVAGAIGDPTRILAALQTGDQMAIARAIRPISETLLIATPFIFVTLGIAVAFHAGLFNFGADGQWRIAGLGTLIVTGTLSAVAAPGLALVGGLAGGALFGAAWAFIPGYLRARTGAHEFVTTLMLNPVSTNLAILFGISGVSEGPAGPLPRIPLLVEIPTIRLDFGFFAALIVAVGVSVLLFRTTLGYELRATGFGPAAARGAGIRPGRSIVAAMSLSGGLIGLGSAFFALGPARGEVGTPSYDLGYVALALALIGGLRPSGAVVVAILYGALNTGAKSMVVETGIPIAILTAIIAFALLFVAAPGLIRRIWRIARPDPAAEATDRAAAAHGT